MNNSSTSTSNNNRGFSSSPERYSLRKRNSVQQQQQQDNTMNVSSPQTIVGAATTVTLNNGSRLTPMDEDKTRLEEHETENDINDMAIPEQQQQQQQNTDNSKEYNDDDDKDEEDENEYSLFTPQHQQSSPFLDTSMSHPSTTDFNDTMLRMDFDLFTGGGLSHRFRSILSGLSSNNHTHHTSTIASLQELNEILSISNEDTLMGMFPCDHFVRELTRILHASNEQGQDISMMDEETMIAFALNNSNGAGNIEVMTLACQCLSNLLHALPSSASNIVAHGAIEILCQKLEPSDYIDLPEQALSVLEKLAVQFPRAVVQGGGLNAALNHFHFFTIHLQRSAIKTAASCFRNIDMTSDTFPRIMDTLPILIETLSYPDNTVVEDTCLCWARLIESCRSSKEHMERIITTDLLEKLVHLMPVPGSSHSSSPVRPGSSDGALHHLLKIFRIISKYSPEKSYQLLELDIVTCFYQIITGLTSIPTEETIEGISNTTISLNNKWRDSMLSMITILVDLLPSLPTELLSPDRFLDSEPISSRTRSARNSSNEGIPPLVKRRTASSSLFYSHTNDNNTGTMSNQQQQQTDIHIQLLKTNPNILKRITFILIPLLIEVYTNMANVSLRELVTHVLVKLVYFAEVDTLRVLSNRISLSAFLADILAQQDHAALIVDALYQSELLFNKLPDIYSDAFEIEGVLHEINIIANMSSKDNSTTITNNNEQEQHNISMAPFTSLIMNNSRLPGYRGYSINPSINDSEVGMGQGATRRYVILLAQNFLRIYNGHVWHQQHYPHHQLSPLTSTTTNGHYQTRLDKLQSISQHLMDCTDMNYVSTLEEFLEFLNSSHMGISGFELSHSGIIDALLFYLTDHQKKHPFLSLRRNAFETFIMRRHPSVLKILMDRLLESLNRSENFQIAIPFDSFFHESDNSMTMLNKRIRVRLIGEGSRIPMRHRHLMASSTIYGIIHQHEHSTNRSAWIPYYRLLYKLVWVNEEDNDPHEQQESVHEALSFSTKIIEEPSELNNNPTCLKTLQLSSAIYNLIMSSSSSSSTLTEATTHVNVFHTESFINRKLTGKLQRQLEEPLIVASNCLPQWTYWFMQHYPFLFPFETRYQFLQSTSYGYHRLMAHWQNLQMRNNTNQPRSSQHHQTMEDFSNGTRHEQQQQSLFHRVARYKAKIPRTHLLQSTTKILDQCMIGSHATLEVQFQGEEGTGLGPTLEFYATMSKEFCKKSFNMWRNEEKSRGEKDKEMYVSTHYGLFPTPMSTPSPDTLKLFQTLGHFVAKSMVDFRMIDIPFSPVFFKVLFTTTAKEEDSFVLIKEIDPILGKSLDDLRAYSLQKKRVDADKALTTQEKSETIQSIKINGVQLEDLCLDFTLPGHPDIKLKNNGDNIQVTIQNLEEYLDLVVDKIIGSGIKEQLNMFRQGFNRVFDLNNLKVLTPNELVALFGNSVEDWSYQTISNAIHADHGFTLESHTVKYLISILADMKKEERRDFLQFTTGSPRLPIGGWQAMRPVFTVVRKQCEPPFVADDYLPSVMTCANYLKLPDYSSKQVLQQRLLKSMREGKNCFLLS
ncbi:hypothetical protein INT45_008462 [Circinella minor]|uniref:HECT-type E3 ubiquitin transferase n=1 Tax=Circinella minor TaxID=1195481 RepID=A0A8H7SFM9_9FUNG|nr:hypothetical protein INT45_008462 [Circinella minor]